MGRPISTSYTDEERAEIVAYVLVQVASGRFVNRVFNEDKTTANGIKIPAQSTFWLWVFQDESNELSEKLVRAREHGVEALLDETLDIADEAAFDTKRNEAGNKIPDAEWITRSRLRVETRFKLAQMLKPKTYGPKLDLTSGNEPVKLDETAVAARIASLIKTGLERDG